MVAAAYTETLEWLQHMVQLNLGSKSSVASVILYSLNRFMMDNIKHTGYDNVYKLLGVFYLVCVPASIKIDELIGVLYGISTVFCVTNTGSQGSTTILV